MAMRLENADRVYGVLIVSVPGEVDEEDLDLLELLAAYVASALRESEARFRRLAENAPDIIFRYRLKPTPTLRSQGGRSLDPGFRQRLHFSSLEPFGSTWTVTEALPFRAFRTASSTSVAMRWDSSTVRPGSTWIWTSTNASWPE